MDPKETAAEITARLEAEEVVYLYAITFCLASAAGIVRAFRDDRYRDIPNLCSVGIVCGFVSTASIACMLWAGRDSPADKHAFVAVAVVIGLAGKEADRYLLAIVGWIQKRLGVDIPEPEDADVEDGKDE